MDDSTPAARDVRYNQDTARGSILSRGVRATFTSGVQALLVAAVLAFSYLCLPSSYWLDECATAWLIQGSPGEILDKSLVLLQPPIPVFLTALSSKLFGGGEVALRIPSAFGAAVFVAVLFRTATELVGRTAAWVAIAFVVCLYSFQFMAADARPYPLALCAASLALLYLHRALSTGQDRHVHALAICLAAAVHVHLLFVYYFAVPALAAALYVRGRQWRAWLQAGALAGLLIAPLYPYYRVLFSWSSGMSWMEPPAFEALFQTLAPTFPLAYFLAGGVLSAFALRGVSVNTEGLRGRGFAIAAIGVILPSLLLFAVSRLTDTRVFVIRYLAPAIPGLCISWGALIAAARPRGVATGAAIIALLVVARQNVLDPRWTHHNEDWRGAMRRARDLGGEGRPGLAMYSAFVESRSIAKLREPRQEAQIVSPASAYPAGIAPLAAIPFEVKADSIAYWESVLEKEFKQVTNLIAVLRGTENSAAWEAYLSRSLPARGYRQTRREAYGDSPGVVVLQFVR